MRVTSAGPSDWRSSRAHQWRAVSSPSVLGAAANWETPVPQLSRSRTRRSAHCSAVNAQGNVYRFSPDGRLFVAVVSEPGRPGSDRGLYKLKVLEWATGTPRSDFELPGSQGKNVKLSELTAKGPVLIYTFIAAFTPT